jgi:hypothetical protein
LVHGTLPAEGAVCDQDWVPFSGFSTAAAVPEATAARAKVTPAMVPDLVRQIVR